jgi:uncharacterized protein YgiM (DUF1202 family)
MGEHQLNEVILSKEDSKGNNIEKQLAQTVQALWEDTHKEKCRNKQLQDQEFSAKLEILDRKLHQEGGVLSGKNAKDLHLVGLGHKNGEAKLLFSDKKKGESEGENLYLVDESGKIVASSELKERKATSWKTVGDKGSAKTNIDPSGESPKAEAETSPATSRPDRYNEHQGPSESPPEAPQEPSSSNDGKVEVKLSKKISMNFGSENTEPESVTIKQNDKSGDLVLKRIGKNDYIAQGSDSDKHYSVNYDKQTGDFTYSRKIENVYDPSAPGERDITIKADGSEIRTFIGDDSQVSSDGRHRSAIRFLQVQTLDPKGQIQSDIRYSGMDGSHPSQATIRMSDGHYASMTASSVWQDSMQSEDGNWYKVSFDNKTGVTKLLGESQVTEVYPHGVATLTPLDNNQELHDYYKQIRIGARIWNKQRGSSAYVARNGERADIEIDAQGRATVKPRA